MKHLLLKKTGLFFLIAGCLYFTSCVDEKIDLNNLSTDISAGGSLAMPLGTADISIAKLLARYKPSGSSVSIGTSGDTITLLYQDSTEYNKPTGLDLTNSYCIDTMYSIKDFAFATDYPVLPQTIPSTTKTYTKDSKFNYTKINDNKNEQKIDSIHFYSSKIEVKTETNLDPGVLKVQIHLTNGDVITLNMNQQLKDTIITENNFSIDVVNKETTIPVDIILTGNGSAQMTSSSFVKIQITPQYNNSQYVAYGTFNYAKPVNQTAVYPINLNKYLPDSCTIYPVNPRIKFDVSSNLGVPIDFKISSLTTKQTKPLVIKNAHFATGDSTIKLINRAYSVGSTASTSFTFDGGDNNGNLDDLFKIKVDTASLNFGFKVNQTTDATEQFIKSDSKVKLNASVTMPVWLAEGSQLAYNDTLKNIDKDLADILNNATEAVIRLNNTNNLPFKINVKVKMLDANFNVITATNIYSYDVNAATTDANGSVIKATESVFYIKYNTATIADLKKAKHLLIETIGNNTGQKMLIKTTNGITIKMGAYATSTGINIKK
ncbi:MAG: hypothetical protein P4L28_03110 [Paludibacteraceae bacterium]|nr:hypothetical protein [Paludibacteraceae bacterium]